MSDVAVEQRRRGCARLHEVTALGRLRWIDSVGFTDEDADRARESWGANCGPGAIAAITGLTLDELRPHLGDFERKRYTNPTLMFHTLGRLGVGFRNRACRTWPAYGLARVQWEGPWMAPGVPMRARYRHTHWVGAETTDDGSRDTGCRIFDINCMCVGGWVNVAEWSGSVVPWLLRECEPKANGRWHLTHVLEVDDAPQA